jgi:capsular polysaccharide biosynthesis protein
MEFTDFIKLLGRKKGTILTVVLIIVLLTLGLSLLSPLKYSSQSRLLVVQNTTGNDPYVISKSNEYLGNLFAQVVYSGSFYNLVMDSPYDINKSYFSGNYNEQMKTWNKTVETKTISDTGIIEINVYHPNSYQAQQISLAINDILMNKNSNYQGNGQAVKVNIIDQPLVSNYPVKPNLLENFFVALASGLLLSIFYVYLFPEPRYDIRLRSKSKSKEITETIKLVKNQAFQHSHQIINEQAVATKLQSSNYQAASGVFRLQGDIKNIVKIN